MRILWIVNTIFPYPSKKLNLAKNVFGGWLLSLCNEVEKNKEVEKIAVVCLYIGKELIKLEDNKIVYYLIPTNNMMKYNKNIENELVKIYKEFKPDIVHVHGTEYPHSLSAINGCKTCHIKTVVSIQGLISKYGYKQYYYADLSFKDRLFNITLRDIIKNDTISTQSKKFRQRGNFEIECLNKCDYIVGRTSWDKSNAYSLVGVDKFKKCNESLRQSFYNINWNIANVERNSIFISQASYPIKGFHKMLMAANILKNKYPNLKIYVAGTDVTKSKSNSLKDRLKINCYGKYLNSLIKKYKLEEHVIFTGLLDEKQMVDRLLKTHIFVQASSIENSPNSLGEAMLLGMPCVASYVGGTADMLLDKQEGFLYPFTEYEMLANYIMELFNNDALAIDMGKNAQKHAKQTHSLEKNSNDMINIYKEVINKEK